MRRPERRCGSARPRSWRSTAAFESGDSGQEYFLPQNTSWMAWKRENINNARRQGHNIIAFASKKADAPTEFDKFHELLEALRKSLLEPYRFSIFAANRLHRSVNFGLVVDLSTALGSPKSYQVGQASEDHTVGA